MVTATVLALSAALLHAAWNLLVKASEQRDLFALGQFLAGGICAAPLLLVVGLPGVDALGHLAASSLVHGLYVGALVLAYHHGDFSVAYPVARGLGGGAAAVGGAIALGDRLTAVQWVAVAVVLGGLTLLVRRGAGRAVVGWAALTGLVIGCYTTIDAAGARRSQGLSYGITLTIGSAVVLLVVALVRGRGPAFAASLRRSWRRYVLSGAFLVASYSMVLVAATRAPLGYVAALRESSVVIAAATGWLLLREPLGVRRVVAAVVVAGGLAALVATG